MLALLWTLALAMPQSPLAIKVDRIVAADGTIGPGGWIVARGERLEAVGAATAPPGAQTLEFPGGVACAGLVDAVTELGASGDLQEPARAFTPEVQAADAFHPDHSDFLNAARGGVTTVGLSPTSSNVVGGRVAIVRTHGPRGMAALDGQGPMRLALSEAAFDSERPPTSRIGALPKLREMLQGDALKGAAPLVVDAGTPDEIRLALETIGAAGRSVALLQPRRADDALESVRGSGALALVGPFDLDASERDLRLPQVLADAGVEVAFAGGGRPAALRLTAALATRAGLEPKLALRALTVVPARILGVESDCAVLEAGRRADLVVFGGDPLDLASKVELVLAGGAVVPQKGKTR
jgi:imidazolonepropionase-like amidohydrolase